VLTSEIFLMQGVELVMDGKELPFAQGSVRAIVMTDVFHHLPDCRQFLESAARCVRPGGRIVAIEPWVSDWSRFVYGRLHHEPFDPGSREWAFPRQGPLSGANGALPWMVFERDRHIFEREFPQWRIEAIRPFMPIRYLVAGGVSMRGFAPGWTFGAFRSLERLTGRLARRTAMFAHIMLIRTAAPWRGGVPAPAIVKLRGEK
jgi:SAM-dependent methyltransferase